MEVAVTYGAVRRAKLHSIHHHQHINTQRFTGQMPFHHSTSVKAVKGDDAGQFFYQIIG